MISTPDAKGCTRSPALQMVEKRPGNAGDRPETATESVSGSHFLQGQQDDSSPHQEQTSRAASSLTVPSRQPGQRACDGLMLFPASTSRMHRLGRRPGQADRRCRFSLIPGSLHGPSCHSRACITCARFAPAHRRHVTGTGWEHSHLDFGGVPDIPPAFPLHSTGMSCRWTRRKNMCLVAWVTSPAGTVCGGSP